MTCPFGSGSTTAAGILAERKSFLHARLSQVVKDKRQEENNGKQSTRSDLKKLGNRIRVEAKDPGQLVHSALVRLSQRSDHLHKIVIDGIRNLGEIEALRKVFGLRF